MKKIQTTLAAITLIASAASAQTPWLHIYRTDKTFNTQRTESVKSIEHSPAAGKLTITGTDGNITSIPMNAVNKCVVGTNVPEIYVTLTEYPNATELWGAKDEVRKAVLSMDGMGIYNDIAETEVEFRGRGNSTWNMEKKPYRFKFSKKQSVCGLPKAKTFALIANHIDCSLMRNAVALTLAQLLGLPFTNHCVPVKVYLNGNYKGAYMLTEKIGIGGGSVDINEDTGILFELDTNFDEDFRQQSNIYRLPVMVKDPDLTEIAAKDPTGATNANTLFKNWMADFNEMEQAVANGKPFDKIDLNRFVDYIMVFNLTANHEICHPKSVYLHKDVVTDKYTMGPVWDFDWAYTFNNTGEGGGQANVVLFYDNSVGSKFFSTICRTAEFREAYAARWKEFKTTIWPALQQYMEEYADMLEPSALENGMLWPNPKYQSYTLKTTFNFRDNVNDLKTWLNTRVNYIDQSSNFGLY